jgi:hypothetical protein
MNLLAPEILQRLIALHSDLGQSNGADRLDPLLKVLAENGFKPADTTANSSVPAYVSAQVIDPFWLCRCAGSWRSGA